MTNNSPPDDPAATSPKHADVDEATSAAFRKAYWDAVRTFDKDAESPRPFYRGIRDPDAFTKFCPRGVVLEQRRDDPSLWDAFIQKLPNTGHEAATGELAWQLGNYCHAMNAKFTPEIALGVGHTKVDPLDVGDEQLPEKRINPDQGIRVVTDKKPRLVVEVEVWNRTPLQLAKHVHQLMTSWVHLRCVIGLKIYKRTAAGAPFAGVCFVWKKSAEGNSIFVERIFDVGPRPSTMTSKGDVAEFWREHNVNFSAVAQGAVAEGAGAEGDGAEADGAEGDSADGGASFKVKPLPSVLECPLPEDCPDDLEDHFTVVVDQADVYHGHSPTRRVQEKRLKHIRPLPDDARLEIDLYALVKRLEDLDAFSAD
mmetsp:Transcript_9741/g.39643  ORF Transcript_9741/g.39643 Transcript_9741/m.39643 type:complete len:368 (+) Transcript_9741:192-1295(+)